MSKEVQSREGSIYIVAHMTLSTLVPWKHFYLDIARCLGCSGFVQRRSPLTSEQREITDGKRLEIIAGCLRYLGKESISRKSFEVPLFMLRSSSSDR